MMREKEEQIVRQLRVTGPDPWGSMYVQVRRCGPGEAVKQTQIRAIADYDKNGRLLGVEVLSAYEHLPK